jgi:hypothetical protein
VWHASVARINGSFTAVKHVSEWDAETMRKATQIALGMLHGVGTNTWERFEKGDSAIHIRRRLKATEMRMLFEIMPTCPVFTHGKAIECMEGPTVHQDAHD